MTDAETMDPLEAADDLLGQLGDEPLEGAEQGPEGGAPMPPDALEEWTEVLGGLLDAWDLVATGRTTIWKFSDAENRLLVQGLAPLAAKRLGGISLSVELTAICICGPILLPRVIATVLAKKKAKQVVDVPGAPTEAQRQAMRDGDDDGKANQ